MIGKPMDVFGNSVDDEGHSLDRSGRHISREFYVETAAGIPDFEKDRDQEYVRELSYRIVDSYKKNTILKSTNLVSFVVFEMLKRANPSMDFYRILRTGGAVEAFPLQEVYGNLARVLDFLKAKEAKGEVLLDDSLREKDVIAIVSEAIAHLGTYHTKPALKRKADRLYHINRPLLLYYQNRLNVVNGVQQVLNHG